MEFKDGRDIINIPLEECKEMILEYQKTKDPHIFQVLLAKFDKYLVYLTHKFYNKYWYIKGTEFQELYHIAIIAFEQGLCSIRPEWRPDGIFLWVGSYIKYAFKKNCIYRRSETSLDAIVEQVGDSPNINIKKLEENTEDVVEEMDKHLMFTSDILTADEKDYIRLRYSEGLFLKEIGKIKGVSYGMVAYILEKIATKLKEHFKDLS